MPPQERGPAKQWALLALVSTLAVAPYLHGVQLNIVTKTYLQASQRIWSGTSPYLEPGGIGDWYKYSPFFAMAYAPFGALPETWHALVWAAFNAILFWLGISEWVRLGRGTPWLVWLSIIGASMELDGSLRYQQVNAALVGATLLALGLYRRKSDLAAGVVLAIAAEIKLLPLLFVLALLVPWRPRFHAGLLLGFAATTLAPAIAFGFPHAWALHHDWIALLGRDLHQPGLLDLESVLRTYHLPWARPFRLGVLVVSTAWLMAVRPGTRWPSWIALGLTCLLLGSPRTESPTFVLAGASYVFLALAIFSLPRHTGDRVWSAGLWVAGLFFLSIVYNDVWPRAWHPRHFCYKTLGTLILWTLSLVLQARERSSVRSGASEPSLSKLVFLQ